ncbi:MULTISPECIES: diacylglycerol kinase family protein [unclassified Fusibacter]|uniref:diacylglycerol/lipid kinase family protein n=1 Tax=unclassified Fusibacter TaxID=2624464 RepID=UPI001010ECB6|nr:MULTISPECIES: diacylglycerol kinase family protein [unclassified Fusibacter]MCK8060858.1 diacylglycerol kinase family lipid kinase [Fusibacter sp. A2]NPE23154.1 diacylglycerol kinase family lipid kinase [Fusibacter sp. A1]RXV59512.1 diacylglycerol kinase family lipid kinase [Fusibacter sp. A1]
MNITIVINPTAGKGLSIFKIDSIENFIIEHGHSVTIVKTEYEGHAKNIVEEYIDCSDIIVVAGGDGTLREGVLGMIARKSKVPMGILPTGTGNDFARTLGIPLDLNEALEVLLKGSKTKVHFGKVNEDIFVNVVSTGFDASIVNTREKIKRFVKGPLSYLVSTIITLVKYQAKEYVLMIDGKKHVGTYFLVAAANGRYYGGGMKVAPKASPKNKQLDICLVKKIGKLKLLYLLPTIYSGKHIETPYVEYFSCDTLSIEIIDGSVLINIDGELKYVNLFNISKNSTDEYYFLT